jgi:hypothetical protein
VTAAEFADLPFGGHAGEWLSGGQTAPAPPPQPLVIEPPPWAGEETGPIVPLAAPASASAAQPTALEVMRADDGDGEWAPPPGLPLVLEPLLPVAIPPVDWRAEQEERARVAARDAQDALEGEDLPDPAPRGAQKRPRWP